jgi:hypothetical protein
MKLGVEGPKKSLTHIYQVTYLVLARPAAFVECKGDDGQRDQQW